MDKLRLAMLLSRLFIEKLLVHLKLPPAGLMFDHLGMAREIGLPVCSIGAIRKLAIKLVTVTSTGSRATATTGRGTARRTRTATIATTITRARTMMTAITALITIISIVWWTFRGRNRTL